MKSKVYVLAAALVALPLASRAQFQYRLNSDASNKTVTDKQLDVKASADGFTVGSWDVSTLHAVAAPGYNTAADPSFYVAPTYADDYRAVNDWAKRSQWQLANVHDPSVMLAADGYYYMYQTDASYGNVHNESGAHFYCRRSRDLVNWEPVGMTMPGVPSWVKTELNKIRTAMGLSASTINWSDENAFGYWAPCVRRVSDNLYRMYYCITCPGTLTSSTKVGERCFIGLMETATPANPDSWVDKGMVITQYSDQELNYTNKSQWGGYYKYNAIDPSYIVTPEGEHWLIYGSWHSGFPAVQIDPATGKTLKALGNPWGSANEAAYGKRIFTRKTNDRWQAAEAPEVIYHDGYYYLFMAFDELAVAYNTRVVRSKNIDGPYEDFSGLDYTNGTAGGSVLPIVTHPYKFSGNHGWVGISHCAVFDDGNGNWYYASQQRYPANYNNDQYINAVMMGGVRRVLWTPSGWPVVLPERYGNVPQTAIADWELVGTWENIMLKYNYQVMDTSTEITLNADHTVSGKGTAFVDGTWSFDPATNLVTFKDEFDDVVGSFPVARECDWEASPRHATLVYAGYDQSGQTYWGKKK